MMRNSVFLALLILLRVMLASAQQPNEIPYRWNNGIGHSGWDVALGPKEQKQLLELWEAIGEDLKTNNQRIAGTYVKLDHTAGYFLRWSVSKGFIVIPYFDQNLITDFGYGKANIVDDSDVIFISERRLTGERGLSKMPERWTAILGYLMPTEELKEFGEFRAGIGEYNEFNGSCCDFSPNFLCHKIDGDAASRSFGIPPKYAHLIKPPITGQITFVGRRKPAKKWGYQGVLHGHWIETAVVIPVTINAGRDAGVKRNMLFRMVGEPDFYQYLQIIGVNKKTSRGYVVRDISGDRKETYRDEATNEEKPLPAIRMGIKVTTSPLEQ